jgi:hypothetical protein
MSEGLFGVFDESEESKREPLCSTVGTNSLCSTVGTNSTKVLKYFYTEDNQTSGWAGTSSSPIQNPVVRSLSFLERENSLIDGTILGFDWKDRFLGERKTPDLVRIAYTLILYPSLRELEGSAVAGRITDIADVAWGEYEMGEFALKFEALQESLPTFCSLEISDLVRAAIETALLPVHTDTRHASANTFVRAINALYHWQTIQGWDRDIAVPCRALARALGHENHDYAHLLLKKAADDHFMRLVSKGGRGIGKKPSLYRFTGRLENGTIEPEGAAQPCEDDMGW